MTIEALQKAFYNWNNKILLEIEKDKLDSQIFNDPFHGYILKPIETTENKIQIQMCYKDEYEMICQTFKNIKFFNFSTEYFIKTQDQRPRIAISINGNIIQQSNREYYVVFSSPTNYMIQVYKLDSNLKRDGSMLFGVLIDEDKC